MVDDVNYYICFFLSLSSVSAAVSILFVFCFLFISSKQQARVLVVVEKNRISRQSQRVATSTSDGRFFYQLVVEITTEKEKLEIRKNICISILCVVYVCVCW